MNDISSRPVLDGPDLDVAIVHARAALAALLHLPVGGDVQAGGDGTGYPKVITEARTLLGALLDHRLALAATRMNERDPVAVAAARADRNEAIAVYAALLYWLPPGNQAWPDVAMTVGRLSYDRYSDAWPDAEPPDPDDLDAACDLLLRAARHDADERTALYLVLALRDRRHLMACPADMRALRTWGERLLAFPGAGGLGQAGLQDMLELELLNRTGSLARAAS
jgi:hypothetical protein